MTELQSWLALLRLVHHVRPAIIHAVTIKPVLYAGTVARLLKVPKSVSTVSGLGYVFLAKGLAASCKRQAVLLGYRAALRQSRARTIFQNDEDRALFVGAKCLRPEQAVMVRGSGVDLELFRYQRPQASEFPVVMCATRLCGQRHCRICARGQNPARAGRASCW